MGDGEKAEDIKGAEPYFQGLDLQGAPALNSDDALDIPIQNHLKWV